MLIVLGQNQSQCNENVPAAKDCSVSLVLFFENCQKNYIHLSALLVSEKFLLIVYSISQYGSSS